MAYKLKFFGLSLLLLVEIVACAAVSNTLALPATVQIKSVRQKILSRHEYLFYDHVDFLLAKRVHLFADRLFFDAEQQCARAEAIGDKSIVIQDDRMIVFAQRCFINSLSGEVFASKARMQGAEGFFAASSLYRDSEGAWWGEDVVYTPCDAHSPHWHLRAKNINYNSSYIKLEKVQFMINKMGVAYLPVVFVPLQKKTNSGFLVPRVRFDYKYGLGLKQDYYWFINNHADITTGIDWKRNRGIFGTGEARWANSTRHSGYFKGYAGYADNIYVQKRNSIVKVGEPQYWLQGKHTYGVQKYMGFEYASSLTLLDNGTDKKTGYEFFDSIEVVDDTFYNGCILRSYDEQRYIQCMLDSSQTSRKDFFIKPINTLFTPEDQDQFVLQQPVDRAIQELDNRSSVIHGPQFFLSSLLRRYGQFSYKDFYMLDYALMRAQETERIFLLSKLAREERIVPRAVANSLRFDYGSDLSFYLPTKKGTFYVSGKPLLSMRSYVDEVTKQLGFGVNEHGLFRHGAYRTLLKGAVGYVAPSLEWFDAAGNVGLTMQHKFYFEAAPFVAQKNWPLFDRFDRHYPTLKLGSFFDYNLNLGSDHRLSCYVKQEYDWVPQPLWFELLRGGLKGHATPLSYGSTYQLGVTSVSVEQEFSFADQKLITSFVHAKATIGQNDFHCGYLFKDITVSRVRRLLAQAPHTFFIGVGIPLGSRARFEYSGFFVADQNVVGWGGLMIVPIKHEMRIEYKGHCWGGYFGVEEKSYRQYGNNKHERAFVLSVYVDSLGSFAKKIKNNNELISNSVSG